MTLGYVGWGRVAWEGSLARQRRSLERPQECTAGRRSHSQLKLPRVTHRCRSSGPGAEAHAVAAVGGPSGPNGALWFRHMGEGNLTVMDELRKRHLGPAWLREVTNSELVNQPITRTEMIYWPPRPAESPEGALKDALALIFHTFCNMFTQLDCFIAAIGIRCD